MDGKKLYRRTKSLCPECTKQIDANIVLDAVEGKDTVLMRKKCAEHGFFEDIISRNPPEYERNQKYYHDFVGIENKTHSDKASKEGCPHDCGMCAEHKGSPCIAVIDPTNRCNLACPICFANANAKGYVVEPTIAEIKQIMEHFRNIKPIPPVVFQFSGGEPTMRDDLVELVRLAKKMGFVETILTTNGLKLAARNGVQYIKDLKAAGLDCVYLSFDSADDPEVYKKTRGVNLLPQKLRVIENCRKAGFHGVLLIPTIARGINEQQSAVKGILDFAKKNHDVVSGIVFQPVSLCGRIDNEQLKELRFTTSDLVQTIGAATGLKDTYIYPIPATGNLTKLLAFYDYMPKFTMAAHPDCGFATIMTIDAKTGKWTKVEDFFDIDGLIKWADEVWAMVEKGEWPNMADKIVAPFAKLFGEKIGNIINQASDFAYRKAIKAYFMAGSLRFMKGISGPIKDFLPIMLSPKLETAASFFETSNNVLVSSMHFQDVYNFDVDRVQRCLVHYGVINPDDPTKVLQIPFCSMNSVHREELEKRHAKEKISVNPNDVTAKAKEFIEKEIGK